MGLLQGVSELFPISSLGHSVVLPALLGWNNLVAEQQAKNSYFLTFLVGLHVATAAALFVFYRRDWYRIIGGLFKSIKSRSIDNKYQKLGWLLVVATIPAGLVGVVFDHLLRRLFAKPLDASIFLIINGIVLFIGEAKIKNQVKANSSRAIGASTAPSARPLSDMKFTEAVTIGVAQIFALLAGISRSGITMVAGLFRGLDHEDAARFSFLLATPIIFAAGVYKLPSLLKHSASPIRGDILIGSIAAFIAAFLSVAFLSRYFKSKTLNPFAIYSIVVGIALVIRFH
ncbi:MAG: undecaprenyl-diphosphate phosphatase [Actinomycetota bacterium]|nr:undecaprenyl-diphosphate phosphatase [Actinomycetota bacterium]